ncbi:MAG: response regulator transcription factor [Vulcanimicrobiaceae bacterium]
MPKRVLIVDDEAQIGEVLGAYLQREGFEYHLAGTVTEALQAIESSVPDVMILDITLPDGSGLDVLRSVRGERKTPTIMLTALADEIDRVLGLELGADDYVTKPFSPREVLARVRAVLRRVEERQQTGAGSTHLRVRDLDVDLAAHEARRGGHLLTLTPSEFRILRVLAERPGQVFTRAQLLDQLNDDGSIYERTLDRHINNLRKKLEPNPDDPSYVVTVYGVGYKFQR